MSNINAAKLIIENIQLLEQAVKLLEGELAEVFFKTVDEVIKKSVNDFEDETIAIYDLHENDTWFLSTKWKREPFNINDDKTHKNLFAYYQILSHDFGEDGNYWWLTNFFNNDYGVIVFGFYLHRDGFNKTYAKDWKAFIAEMNQNYPQIEQLGFKFDTEGWYLPIASLDSDEVVKNYENDTLEDALIPITEALNTLKQAHPYFNQIVQAAIAKFGRVEVEETV